MHVVLVQPEIAPNTGNIIRLCANTGATLHLIEPLGFSLEERNLRRAGLDYHELAEVIVHPNLAHAVKNIAGRWFTFSSGAATPYAEVSFLPTDVLVFGAERGGLTATSLAEIGDAQPLTIPMMPGNRSLNLANAVAVVVYEAWRQQGFSSAEPPQGLDPESAIASGLTSETPRSAPFDT